jgi:hypothetical protein
MTRNHCRTGIQYGAHIQRHLLVAGACVLGLLSGCDDGRETVNVVKGKITVGGEPAGGAIIVLIPQEGNEEFLKMRPNGETDDDGNFEINSYLRGDGAPAGRYKAVIQWFGQSEPAPLQEGEEADDEDKGMSGPVDLLEGRYSDVNTTPLEITIVDGENILDVFELE